jgi:hypothetical protein
LGDGDHAATLIRVVDERRMTVVGRYDDKSRSGTMFVLGSCSFWDGACSGACGLKAV